MKEAKKYFYEEMLSDNEYLIYNSKLHIPIKINKQQKIFFDLIFQAELNEELNLSNEEFAEFQSFLKQLKDINFLSLNEEIINKDSLMSSYEDGELRFYVHLTNKCNLRCKYCFNEDKRTDKHDLSFDDWKIILDKILPLASNIILTGGEALLHPYFKEIVLYIRSNNSNLFLELFSNGSNDFEEIELGKILENIDKINLSCDNIENEDHGRIGFDRKTFLKNIEYLKTLNLRSRVNVNSVWGKGKLYNLKKVQSFCFENNLKSTITIYIPNDKISSENMPSIEEFSSYDLVVVNSDSSIQDKSILNKSVTCEAATRTFSIDPQGNVYPCQSFHFSEFLLGNILTQDLDEIYNSTTAKMLRFANDVNNTEVCKDCNLKYICGGGCIANTFEIEKGFLKYPQTMCEYYKQGAISRLKNVEY